MKTETKASSYRKALTLLRHEVSQIKEGTQYGDGSDLAIVPRLKIKKKRLQLLTWRRMSVIATLFILYVLLVCFVTIYQAQKEGVTSQADPRFVALGLTKLLDWLFVPGPQTSQETVHGQTTYFLPQAEVLNWLATVGIALLGWGSIISIPTLLVDSFIAKAGERDQEIKENLKKELELALKAQSKGRLEISHPSFSVIFTHTSDPIARVLIESLEPVTRVPWVVVQSGEAHNTVQDLANHVFIPDLANTADYDGLLHASRIQGNNLIVLTSKPGHKFLVDPNQEGEVDLTTSDVVSFVENVVSRTHRDVKVVIVGPADSQSVSQSFKGKSLNTTTSLADVAEEIGAVLIDPDQILMHELFRSSGGKEIYVEFTGSERRIEQYKNRLKVLISRYAQEFPLHIVNNPKDAVGGIFYMGDDVEGVALTQKRLGIFTKDQPHFIVFESIDRIDEVEEIGFSSICIDYVVSKNLIKILTTKL